MKLLLDLDGVLGDFMSAAIDRMVKARLVDVGISPAEFTSWNHHRELGISDDDFWRAIDDQDFWAEEILPYPWAEDLLAWGRRNFGKYNVFISTSPSLSAECLAGKSLWLNRVLGIPNTQVMLGAAKWLMAKPMHVLIDDSERNVERFIGHGGNAIVFPQYWNRFGVQSAYEDFLPYLDDELDIIKTDREAVIPGALPGPGPVA